MLAVTDPGVVALIAVLGTGAMGWVAWVSKMQLETSKFMAVAKGLLDDHEEGLKRVESRVDTAIDIAIGRK
jgi:hypothetical protein